MEIDLEDFLPAEEETKKESKEISVEVQQAWESEQNDVIRKMLLSMGVSQDFQLQHFGTAGNQLAKNLIEADIIKRHDLEYKKKEIEHSANVTFMTRIEEAKFKHNLKLQEIGYKRIVDSGKLDSQIESQFMNERVINPDGSEIERLRKENALLKVQQMRKSK